MDARRYGRAQVGLSSQEIAALFAADVQEVALRLLGHRLGIDGVEVRITELEAYAGPEDGASHARFGQTDRNSAMWAEGATIYMYLCYGIHDMFNLVTGPPGQPSALLVRGCEVVRGHARISERRGGVTGRDLLAGPGKVAQGLGLERSWNGGKLGDARGLVLDTPDEVELGPVATGPRIGIDFAPVPDVARPWRFALPERGGVSHRRRLGVSST